MNGYEKLSYREVGQRLGITTDAARMKAKRMAKAGRWRLIPGNHPADPVTVEVPEGTLVAVERDAGAPPATHKPDGDWRRFSETLVARVETLTNELVAAKENEARALADVAHARREIEELRARLKRRGWIKGQGR